MRGVYSRAALITNLVTTTVNLLCNLNVNHALNTKKTKNKSKIISLRNSLVKRRKEIGLAVPARCSVVSTELRMADVLEREN